MKCDPQLGLSISERDVRAIERDGRSVVLLKSTSSRGDDLLAYAPHDAKTRAQLERERALLKLVGPRLSFETPLPLGDFNAFDLRKRVRGEADLAFHRRALEDQDAGDRLASWMAAALAELHGALHPEELAALDLAAPEWPPATSHRMR